MTEPFLTFQKFHDLDLAEKIADHLKENNIEYLLEDNRGKYFDISFANNSIDPDILLKLKGNDFSKARLALDNYYKSTIENIDEDYYLFGFSDGELLEIITKPDEWGNFDYQLAQKILSDRGIELKPDTVLDLREKRIEELSSPEKAENDFITSGYIFAFLGGFIGIIIGWILRNNKKTLPNGQRVFVYTAEDRIHGKLILRISTVVFVLVIILRIILLFKGDDY